MRVDEDGGGHLRVSSRETIETMLWGAVCMPDSRDRILGMESRMFSRGFNNLLTGFKESMKNSKVDPKVCEWFMENQVSIVNSKDLLESVQSALKVDAERVAMKRLAGELSYAAKIGNRDVLVKLMKECLVSLGE
jgi:hypothetical protein